MKTICKDCGREFNAKNKYKQLCPKCDTFKSPFISVNRIARKSYLLINKKGEKK